ncbi:MAG: hypothetical protein V3S08_08670 [Phycisphaerales bacterium]
MKADAKDLLRRNTRPWRAVFVAYALLLTTATHWPALDIGRVAGGGFKSPDKIIHTLAFAGLLVLLWRTRWVPRIWQAGVIVLAWTVLDEVTQALPVLHRTFSMQDLVASQIGVVVTLAWFRALAPVGGPANRVRIDWLGFVIDDLFARPGIWVLTALAGAGGAAVIGAATWAILATVDLDAIVRASVVFPASITVGGVAGGIAAGLAALAAGVRRRARTLGVLRPCFACGSSCRDAAVAENGRGPCPACGTVFHTGQWSPPMLLPLSVVARGAGRAALAGAGVLVAAMAVYFLVLRSWDGLAPDMRLTIDMALIAVAMAVAVRVYRGRQAPLYDRQHTCCRWCDHDLTGTEVTHGCGRCGECGTPFARITDG